MLRRLQLPEGQTALYKGQMVLLYNSFHARYILSKYFRESIKEMNWISKQNNEWSLLFSGMILVTSSFVTFWIEWNAVPARVMLGVTTMLNFFTTSNGFRSNLPVIQVPKPTYLYQSIIPYQSLSNIIPSKFWGSIIPSFLIGLQQLGYYTLRYLGKIDKKKSSLNTIL